ncbi:Ubiquitin-associated/translation elongation factor EF1B protein [Euphorbia peplus]|nr:Ubiquitin-associated/translation elongation factor EF1B protein [Euphorbia peplus]
MDYDFRNRAASPYDAHSPMYRTTSSSTAPSSHPMYGQSLYPRVGQQGQTVVPPVSRNSYNQTSAPAPSSGLGIRIALKPEYRITPLPQLAPEIRDIQRSNFEFDFELEKKILAEVEKGSHNFSRLGLENLPSRTSESSPSLGAGADPVMSKYIASGLNREAVALAIANYGDNPTKVEEFAKGYRLLKEMGFSSKNVGEALLMCDNDTDKALAHCLNASS